MMSWKYSELKASIRTIFVHLFGINVRSSTANLKRIVDRSVRATKLLPPIQLDLLLRLCYSALLLHGKLNGCSLVSCNSSRNWLLEIINSLRRWRVSESLLHRKVASFEYEMDGQAQVELNHSLGDLLWENPCIGSFQSLPANDGTEIHWGWALRDTKRVIFWSRSLPCREKCKSVQFDVLGAASFAPFAGVLLSSSVSGNKLVFVDVSSTWTSLSLTSSIDSQPKTRRHLFPKQVDFLSCQARNGQLWFLRTCDIECVYVW